MRTESDHCSVVLPLQENASQACKTFAKVSFHKPRLAPLSTVCSEPLELANAFGLEFINKFCSFREVSIWQQTESLIRQ